MAYVGTVVLTRAPWRDTEVEIFKVEQVEGRAAIDPTPGGDPLFKVPIGKEGELTFDATASPAYVVTGDAEDNNAILWTAADAGAEGNEITIELVDPEGTQEPLAVSVNDSTITVSLQTDNAGEIISTASDVIAAINGDDPGAADLVTADDAGDSTGAGVVEPAVVALANGYEDLSGAYCAVAVATDGTLEHRFFQVEA